MEELIRYAHTRLSTEGETLPPARVSKLIRRLIHRCGERRIDAARVALDDYIESRTWIRFDLFVNGYVDPTGAHAARNLDMSGAAETMAARRAAAVRGG